MDGIPLTKIWGMAYLVSFLVLEGLDLLQPRQHRDYHALEPDAAVLDTYMWLPGFLAVLTQHLCLLLQLCLIASKLDFKCDLERGSYPPEFGRVTNALIIFGLMACYILFMLTVFVTAYLFVNKLNKLTVLPPLLEPHVELIQILLWDVTCYYPESLILISHLIESKCAFNPVLVQMLAISLLLTSVALSILLNETAYEDTWFRQTLFLIRWFRELFGLKRSERGERGFSLLFATLSITSIIYYYMHVYNPFNTYKPPWTEYLG